VLQHYVRTSLCPLNPDLCKSSEHSVLTANKGDSNHEVTNRGPNMAAGGVRRTAGRGVSEAGGMGVSGPFPGVRPGGCSCRLKFLWTVNLGAGLGAVSGARREALRSPPPEPANPDNAPITSPRPSLPQPARSKRRYLPIILRRDDISSPLHR